MHNQSSWSLSLFGEDHRSHSAFFFSSVRAHAMVRSFPLRKYSPIHLTTAQPTSSHCEPKHSKDCMQQTEEGRQAKNQLSGPVHRAPSSLGIQSTTRPTPVHPKRIYRYAARPLTGASGRTPCCPTEMNHLCLGISEFTTIPS